MVKKYLPILDGEEEEEEDKTGERNDKLNESNSNDINISKDLGKGSKQLSAIYQSLKEIDNKINTVKDSVQIVELNSKKYPDTSNITPINEEDSHLNNLCKYINDLSGKINYLEHTLNIDIEEDEEEEENNNEDQKEKNKDDDTKKQSKDGKKSKKIKGKEDIYDKEPLQEEIKSSFPFFKSSNKCYYCGSQICHFCSKCRHFVCLVCTNSILHIDDDVE